VTEMIQTGMLTRPQVHKAKATSMKPSHTRLRPVATRSSQKCITELDRSMH